jgi:hypothetical protein
MDTQRGVTTMSDTGKNDKNNFEAFTQFVMHVMQSSEESTRGQSAIKQQVINFYLAIFTALIGGAIVVITNITDNQLKLAILTLDLAVISGFGMLSFATILNTIVGSTREGFLRVFLYQYFRDLNPNSFEKYGFSQLLSWHRKAFDRKSYIQLVDILELISLSLFSSCLLGGAAYTLSSLINGAGSIPFSIFTGFLCIIAAITLWVRALRAIADRKDEAMKLFAKYHIEVKTSNLQNK